MTEPFIFVVESQHEKVTEYFARHPTPVLLGLKNRLTAFGMGFTVKIREIAVDPVQLGVHGRTLMLSVGPCNMVS